MSPLFGKKKEQEQADKAAMQVEVERLRSLPLTQLAAEVMTKSFGPSGPNTDGVLPAGMLADPFVPDSVRAQPTRPVSPPRGHEQDGYWQLRALVREGVQVLEHSDLVLYEAKPPGPGSYKTTRLGFEALTSNTVDNIIDGGSV